MAKQCWARSLGDCRGKITGEHYISECAFSEEETYFEHSRWAIPKRRVPVRTLKTHMLCEGHNSGSANLDAAAKEFRVTTDRIAELDNDRALVQRIIPKTRPPVKKWKVDGLLLERWAMKTAVNCAYGYEEPIGGVGEPGMPTDELVAVIFGRKPPRGYAGLYAAVAVGENLGPRTKFVATWFNSAEGYVAGMAFTFRSYRFLAWLAPEIKPPSLSVTGSGLRVPLLLRPRSFRLRLARRPSQLLTFDWGARNERADRRRRRMAG